MFGNGFLKSHVLEGVQSKSAINSNSPIEGRVTVNRQLGTYSGTYFKDRFRFDFFLSNMKSQVILSSIVTQPTIFMIDPPGHENYFHFRTPSILELPFEKKDIRFFVNRLKT